MILRVISTRVFFCPATLALLLIRSETGQRRDLFFVEAFLGFGELNKIFKTESIFGEELFCISKFLVMLWRYWSVRVIFRVMGSLCLKYEQRRFPNYDPSTRRRANSANNSISSLNKYGTCSIREKSKNSAFTFDPRRKKESTELLCRLGRCHGDAEQTMGLMTRRRRRKINIRPGAPLLKRKNQRAVKVII